MSEPKGSRRFALIGLGVAVVALGVAIASFVRAQSAEQRAYQRVVDDV